MGNSRTTARKALITALLAGGVALVPTIGCSSSSDEAAATPKTSSPSLCPATVADTNGKACSNEGLQCTPHFACGAANQLASCTCTSGKFACSDGVGPIAPGATPQCGGAVTRSAACPDTIVAADGAKCAEPWHVCVYKGTSCPKSDRPAIDVCYCRPNDAGLAYYCEPSSCSPPVPPREAGAPDTGTHVDAGSDASTPVDAAGGD